MEIISFFGGKKKKRQKLFFPLAASAQAGLGTCSDFVAWFPRCLAQLHVDFLSAVQIH